MFHSRLRSSQPAALPSAPGATPPSDAFSASQAGRLSQTSAEHTRCGMAAGVGEPLVCLGLFRMRRDATKCYCLLAQVHMHVKCHCVLWDATPEFDLYRDARNICTSAPCLCLSLSLCLRQAFSLPHACQTCLFLSLSFLCLSVSLPSFPICTTFPPSPLPHPFHQE